MKRKPKRVHNPQRRCIFCNGVPVTGEHLFPEWIKSLVPRTSQRHIRAKVVSKSVGFNLNEPHIKEAKRHEGDLASSRIRCACGTCNSGWMSNIETAAIPVMTPLILGENVLVTPAAQEVLSI